MMSPENNPTLQTYNEIAQRYYDRNKDRSPIDHHLRHFIELLNNQGLAEMPVLDIGCGPGFDTTRMREEGLRCIGLDLSWGMLRTGQLHFPNGYVLADMLRLPAGKVVGGLWSCASLLHLERDQLPAALKEFSRVLVKNGILYLSLKTGVGHTWSDAPYGASTRRLFTYWEPSDLDALIEAAGFQIQHALVEALAGDADWLARFAVRF